jgi:2-oxoglutarate dehydrogenase E1 component
LGFEYGYSLIEKDGLTIWEAQFGDFSNNALPIVDQYLACGETKWAQYSNLTMFLPHSYDGQGPEHSSARPERYLQLCSENNMIICNITTPANFFHLLRRQSLLPKRVPLIVFTPKSMLRHPLVSSDLNEFTNGKFLELIDNNVNSKDSYRKLVFLTGKVYYDVLESLHKKNINDIAIIRLEQLYPLDNNLILNALNKYPNAREIVWFQEEPKNQGYWTNIAMHFNEYFPGAKIKYIGRKASSATATGSSKIHILEQNHIIDKLLE